MSQIATDTRYAPEGVKSLLKSEAIIRSAHWQASYPIECLSKRAVKKVTQLVRKVCNDTDVKNLPVQLRVLEAYLAVTGQRLDYVGGAFRPLSAAIGFFGAIYSKRFHEATSDKRYRWARNWRLILGQVCPKILLEVPKPSLANQPDWFADASERFEQLPLIDAQVELWRGWAFLNRAGQTRWYDFRALYVRYGRDFVTTYAHSVNRFYVGRRAQNLPLVQQFADFLSLLPRDWTGEMLSSPVRMHQLLVKFLNLTAKDFDERGLQYSTLRDQWVDFSFFVKTYLCAGSLIAKETKIPCLPEQERPQSETHRRVEKDGTIVVTKLLTDVPLYISNEQAVQLLYHQVSEDVEAIRRWALREVNNIWNRRQRRIELAKAGTRKEIRPNVSIGRVDSVKRGSPNWEANACATFEHHGFVPSREGDLRSHYPAPLGELASDTFGLPVKSALIPHMTLLVLAHPKLTASFFEELMLYEPNSELAGIGQTDIGWVLDGHKLRKGPATANQQIHLSTEDSNVIAQVIELTRPLRDYLKRRKDQTWRYLFLQCGKGFSYPMRVCPPEETSYRRETGAMAASFLASQVIPADSVERLSKSFSLTTLRASVAVCAYVKEPSIRKLAELLGHESVDMRLLKRYMPPALLDFFQNRWVRLFQCGILLEALKESPFALPATGFTTLNEMTQFLENHALKWRPRDYATQPAAKAKAKAKAKVGHFDDEVVFSVCVENLTILESLRLAVEQPAGRTVSRLARMWRDFSTGLFNYIEQSSPPRDDFIAMLEIARERASVTLIDCEAIYA
ncbi:hypothetical protein [Paraburkholderia metrosideri]|uniref:Site-specific integrase n=1 Tax=Paraburkholderia metrosideri TaxID=580937 RepID=A0ABN7HXB5_9BURK|nr:hypothetical protein [Paraburkholderia metrosideri]CAD6542904.1 hypothetical protein LMG28140_03836 [Paraburkholderia metrosideri]